MSYMKVLVFLTVFSSIFFCQCRSKLIDHERVITRVKESTHYVKLQKGGCFGECKMYEITISNDGNSIYIGKLNVARIGKYVKRFDKKELRMLWKLIEESELDKLKDEFGLYAVDTQPKILTYTKNNITKTIQYKQMVPKVVVDIEVILEKLSESDNWEKID